MTPISITWHGHSCFSITWEGYTVVTDPSEDGYVPNLSPMRLHAHNITCSHLHGDHCATHVVKPLHPVEKEITVETVFSYHDAFCGALRGENTIHILNCGGFRICHLGDLGTPLSPQQLSEIGKIDLLLTPVGGTYTIDHLEAAEICRQLAPKVIIPMHYRHGKYGFDVLDTVAPFLSHFESYTELSGNGITITEETKAGVYLLSYIP